MNGIRTIYDRAETGQTATTRLRETASAYTVRPDAPEGESDALLLARLLHRSVPRCTRLLQRAGGLPGLGRLTTGELQQLHGLTLAQAERLRMALEIGRRLPFPPELPLVIRSAVDVAHLLLPLEALEQEQLWVVVLTTQHAVIAVETLYIGTIDHIGIRPAEVFRSAIRLNAAAVVVAHSQPSGDPEPSAGDLVVTRLLLTAGQLLHVPLLDHLVLGAGRWISLRERHPVLWATAPRSANEAEQKD